MTILEPAPAPAAVTDQAPVVPAYEPVRATPLPERHHGHLHGVRCYWDFRECRWVCAAS
jgi:hypothetical protein